MVAEHLTGISSSKSGAEKYMTTTKSGSEQMDLYPYMFLHIWRSVL
jgi:hypothetical protein